MIKNKIDFKIINLSLIVIILFLIYKMFDLWQGMFSFLLVIFGPFFIAFCIAYFLSPILNFLVSKNISKLIAIGVIIIIFLILILSFLLLFIPLLYEQSVNLVINIIIFVKNLIINHNLNLHFLENYLTTFLNDIILNLSIYISNGAKSIINFSYHLFTNIFIILVATIYFLFDMDKIRNLIKKTFKNSYLFEYFYSINFQMKQYLLGFYKISIITFFEYSIIYFIIGHPNALLLGFLSAISNFMPIFGGLLVGLVAIITALVSFPFPALAIKTIIVTLLFSLIDAYFINPLVYKKSNKIHPLIIMFAILSCSVLFGFIGIIIAIPMTIVLITSYQFFISGKIKIKDN